MGLDLRCVRSQPARTGGEIGGPRVERGLVGCVRRCCGYHRMFVCMCV